MSIQPPSLGPALSGPLQLDGDPSFDLVPASLGALGTEPGLWLADGGSGGSLPGTLGGGVNTTGAQDSAAAFHYLNSLSKPNGGSNPQQPDNSGGAPSPDPGPNPGPIPPTDSQGTGLPQSGLFDVASFTKSSGGGHGGGGGGTPPPQYVKSNSAGMTFVVNWDSSVGNAPSGFVSGFESAVQYFLDTFASPITITLNVGYGEVLGQKLPFGALGESNFNVNPFTYSQLYNAMSSWGTSGSADQQAALKSLPTSSDPLNATQYLVSSADQKALGLKASDGSLDGGVGFATNSFLVRWNYNSTTTSGQYDFVNTAKHEISEVMGREAWVGMNVADGTTTYNNSYSNLDLFRYASFDGATGTGTRSTTTGGNAYLSVDGGQTNLSNFNTNPSNGDLGDWAGTTLSNDAYNYAAGTGALQISAADTRTLNVLGYTAQPGVA